MRKGEVMNIDTSQIWQGILRREWLLYRRVLAGLRFVWLLLFLALPVMGLPGEILTLSSFIGLLIGLRLGSSDAREAGEEFSLTLPPTRSHYFLVRFAAGIFVVLGFLFSATFMAYAVPRLWGVIVESGMSEITTTEGSDWDLISSSLFVVGLYIGTYSIAFLMPRRLGGISAMFGLLWCCGVAFLSVCVSHFFSHSDLDRNGVSFLLDDRYSWSVGCQAGGWALFVIAYMYGMRRQFSGAAVEYLRILLLVLFGLGCSAVVILVAGQNASLMEVIASRDFQLGRARWHIPALLLSLLLLFVLYICGLRRARLTRRTLANEGWG
ncbi:MAG: hypothetical protein R3F19_17350 [Verrucomicrobiales bacterium]